MKKPKYKLGQKVYMVDLYDRDALELVIVGSKYKEDKDYPRDSRFLYLVVREEASDETIRLLDEWKKNGSRSYDRPVTFKNSFIEQSDIYATKIACLKSILRRENKKKTDKKKELEKVEKDIEKIYQKIREVEYNCECCHTCGAYNGRI